MCDGPDLFLCILAVLFPPIAVWVKRGLCSADSLINIALCLLGFLPGLLHAWYIVSKYPDPGYEAVDSDEADVRVYYVRGNSHQGGPPPSAGPTAGAHTAPPGSYGTIGQANKNTKKNGGSGNNRSQQQPRSSGGNSGAHNQAAEQAQPVPGVSYAAVAETENQSASKKIREQQLPDAGDGAGPSDGPAPPSYSEVVQGDHKIQSHE